MTELRGTVELWPCGYTAKCSAPECRRRATTILRYIDNQERPDRQVDACDDHASEMSAELRVINRRRQAVMGSQWRSRQRTGIVERPPY